MIKFRISSAAIEDLKCILERQINGRRSFGVVVSALMPVGVRAFTPQHCRSTRMGSESAKAEHDQISNFVGYATEDLKCILERQIHGRRWFEVVVSALVPAGVQE